VKIHFHMFHEAYPHPPQGTQIGMRSRMEMGLERKEVLLAGCRDARDQRLVALEITPLEVIQQPPPLPHELEKPAPRMMIFRVRLEMLGQVPVRSLSSAICTSGDPGVGLVDRRYASTMCCASALLVPSPMSFSSTVTVNMHLSGLVKRMRLARRILEEATLRLKQRWASVQSSMRSLHQLRWKDARTAPPRPAAAIVRAIAPAPRLRMARVIDFLFACVDQLRIRRSDNRERLVCRHRCENLDDVRADALLRAYRSVRPFTDEEHAAWPWMFARGSAAILGFTAVRFPFTSVRRADP